MWAFVLLGGSSCNCRNYPAFSSLLFHLPHSLTPLFRVPTYFLCHVLFHYPLQHFLRHCEMTFVWLTWRRLFSGSFLSPRSTNIVAASSNLFVTAFSCTFYTFSHAHLIMNAIFICMLVQAQIFVLHREKILAWIRIQCVYNKDKEFIIIKSIINKYQILPTGNYPKSYISYFYYFPKFCLLYTTTLISIESSDKSAVNLISRVRLVI